MNTYTSSCKWKHRLYAFVLRRALSPFLTDHSAANLHSSIQEVDLSCGKIALENVELDPLYLTKLLHENYDNEVPSSSIEVLKTISVKCARIKQLIFHISLRDIGSLSKSDDETTSGMARNATAAFLHAIFRGDTGECENNSSAIALIAHVDIEGLDIVFAPSERKIRESSRRDELNEPHCEEMDFMESLSSFGEQQIVPPSFFSSLLESSMKSLHLSVNVTDVRIRAFSKCCDYSSELDKAKNTSDRRQIFWEKSTKGVCWVSVHIASLRYFDSMSKKVMENSHCIKGSSRSYPENMISKAFEWEELVIDLRQVDDVKLPFLQSIGKGYVILRVFDGDIGHSQAKIARKQDIEISFGNQIDVDISECSIIRLIEIFEAFSLLKRHDLELSLDIDLRERMTSSSSLLIHADESTQAAYDQIMERYAEARHHARTRELRGGILLPCFNYDDSDKGSIELSFDTFFDTNETSISYDCEIEGEKGVDVTDTSGFKGNSRFDFSSVTFEIMIAVLNVKLHIDHERILLNTTSLASSSPSHRQTSEFVLVSIEKLQVIITRSDIEVRTNCTVSHFDIESQMEDFITGNHSTSSGSIVRFFDSKRAAEKVDSGLPCISMLAQMSKGENYRDERRCCRVDLMFQPIEIVYRERAVSLLSKIASRICRSKHSTSVETEGFEPSNLHVSASCNLLSMIMPCLPPLKLPGESGILFQRRGYRDTEYEERPFLGLGLELENILIEFSNNCSHLAECEIGEESKAIVKLSRALLFAKSTKVHHEQKGRRKFAMYQPLRTDLVAFNTSENSVSDSFLMLAYSLANFDNKKTRRRKSLFPVVLPLSSIKSYESDQLSNHEGSSSDFVKSQYNVFHSRSKNSIDPQYVMSTEANEVDIELSVNIPSTFFDITVLEMQELNTLLLQSGFGNVHSKSDSETSPAHSSFKKGEKSSIGLSINVDQISMVFHGFELSKSYCIIVDKLKMHSLILASQVKNLRVLSNDVTLYELSSMNYGSLVNNTFNPPASCKDRCKRMQEKFMERTSSKAIFFRSKLCQPLSPEFPALLIDVYAHDDDHTYDECFEKNVHVYIYDMTYRYVMNSEWFTNLMSLVKDEVRSHNQEIISQESDRKEAPLSVTNLFVNLTDCNFDYVPPLNYKTASRIVLRIGELRLTSNIVAPCSKVQAYKVSLCDASLYLCNYRYPYNEENSLLSCSHLYFNKDDLTPLETRNSFSGRQVLTFDGVLCKMDFVNVFILDSFNCNIRCSGDERLHGESEPIITLESNIGKILMFCCKDTFTCLSDTFNEWVVRLTVPSDETMQKLKALSEPEEKFGTTEALQLNTNTEMYLPVCEETMKVTAMSECRMSNTLSAKSKKEVGCTASGDQPNRDDSAVLDISKCLLFKDYYTIDAINHRPEVHRNQRMAQHVQTIDNTDSVTQSTPIDETWSKIEHSYILDSDLAQDQEQRAEWILPDKKNSPLQREEFSGMIKVFPQHVPMQPTLDTTRRKVDPAYSVGTDIASRISVRFIINDATIICRFFDGLDWVQSLARIPTNKEMGDRKTMLLNYLIDADQSLASTFYPFSDERYESSRCNFARKKLHRNVDRYFQLSIIGLSLKHDSYANDSVQQLASCLDLSITEFFLAETIRGNSPVKMIGEWINEAEHPRDDHDGMIMLKMVTKPPSLRVSADGRLMSDESRATLELIPLRCYFNQSALVFIRNFFTSSIANNCSDKENRDHGNEGEQEEIIPVFFVSFYVRPTKLKVDYCPEKMDVTSLREGNYIEILNLCPLEDMVLTLQAVENRNLTGWGSVLSELASRWIEDICATQPHKFFTRATPLQFLCSLTEGVADLAMVLVVPDGSISDYFKNVLHGTTSFAGIVACETLTTSAKLTRYAADQMNAKADPSLGFSHTSSRHRGVVRHAADGAEYGYESISRGLRVANYKIVTVPLREYQQSGASGAARSAVRGIPVAVLAPLSGASEALSYTLLGLRNHLRPDLRKEQEASLSGLNFD